ncbi:DJ-1/PfpI family protein [Aspergillus lucknowensis]|uniref:DJ-1/PfpI family protein n=1 Tax=Aspergillus lucknowensis TaxID=176173 RepID=A0ABR4L5Z7_9EURO
MKLSTALTRAISIALLSLSKNVAGDQIPAPSPDPVLAPKTFGVLLFRAFEPLDIYGPLEALSLLASETKLDLHFLAETLDPVTTRPLMPSMNPFNSSFFVEINPTHTLDNAPDLDVLIVPGGLGTRSPYLNNTLDWIAETYPKLQYLITICTGSSLVAQTGILDGRRATTNKAAYVVETAKSPNVDWVPRARWVVDGNIWTSSGVSAGIDATLAFIEEIYGAENATSIANFMEYERHTDPSWDPFADIWDVPGA